MGNTTPFNGQVLQYQADGTKYTVNNVVKASGDGWDANLSQDGATKPFNGQVVIYIASPADNTLYTLSNVQTAPFGVRAHLVISGGT